MNTHVKCKLSLRHILCALAFIFLVLPLHLSAQTSPLADRLPPDTIFYVQWHGKAFLADADKQNHLLQLLEDPDFTPLWQLAAKNFQQNGAKQSAGAKPPEFGDILSLLDGAGVFGVVANPARQGKPVSDGTSSPFGVFLVYDSRGKRELIQKLQASSRGKEASPVSSYDFGGMKVEFQTTGKDTSYTALAADYFLFANQKSVIEDLIARFRSGTPSTSIAQLPEYQSIRKNFDSTAAIEYFFHMPDLNALVPPDQKNLQSVRVMQGLHLDKIHAAAGSISFSGPATRFRGEVLGDTSPGSLFDVAGPSSATFLTQSIAGNNPNFNLSRMNFVSLYKLIRNAVVGNVPPQQAANIKAAEAMAQNFLGMPITDALDLFTGEIASTASFADDGTELRMYAATIQKPSEVLRVVRAVGATMMVAEDSSGDTTFLDLAFPYKDPSTSQQRKKFYYVAVTPQMLLAAPRKAMLREAIERLKSPGPPTGGMFENAEYLQLRAHLPEKLSGLSGSDLAHVPWDKMFATFTSQFEAAMKSQGQTPTDQSWLKLIKPDVVSRHLHMSVSGWWKDSNGIHFDSYVE